MLAGEFYQAMDPQLSGERLRCRELIHAYNATPPNAFAQRAQLLRELFGGTHKTAYIEPPFRCDYGYNVFVGKAFYANFDCVFLDVNRIEIGEHVKLGPGVHLYTAAHPTDPEDRKAYKEFGKPIRIGANVWIGGGAIVCPGVTIGENAVIGAGSVVTKDIPANVMAAGNPCRVIREL
ncbi:sugar O-acetyltransferase [Pelagicoccus sp. SDUM812003]|nr:sugar O-acetyltransferase [Pelagicoccus sp. SDUM812003]MDQ8205052.1 sugar O-acetyltransferase [Pelagicoccus sp. SDUM812003]